MEQQFVDVLSCKEEVKNSLGDYGDQFCNYSDYQYICDVISEISDSNVDIFYYDLFEWCKENFEYVEKAIGEGLCDLSNPDIPKMIQAGQYTKIQQDLYNNLDAIMYNYCMNYILNALQLEKITKEQDEQIQEKCTDVDNNDTLEDFTDFINKLLNINNEEE